MSQSNVLSVLYRNKSFWMSSKDIADKLHVAQRNICVSLRKLRRHNDVFWKGQLHGRMLYKYKED